MSIIYFTVNLIITLTLGFWIYKVNKKSQAKMLEEIDSHRFSLNKRSSQIRSKLKTIMEEMKKDGYVSSTENAIIIEKMRVDNEETLEDFEVIKREIEEDFEVELKKLSDIEKRTNQQNREIQFDLQQLKQNIKYIQKNFLND